MKFIQLGFKGVQDYFSHLIVLLLTLIMLIGVGQYPFHWYLRAHHLTLGKDSLQTILNEVGKNTFLFFQLLPFVLALIVFIIAARVILHRNFGSFITLRTTFSFHRFFLSAAVTFLLLGSSFAYDYYATTNVHWYFTGTSFMILLLISLIMITLQVLFEEVLFRGFILQLLGRMSGSGWMSIVGSGVIFGCMHLSNPEIQQFGIVVLSYYLISGVFLAWITFMDEGTELAFGFHWMNNLFASIVVTNTWQVFQTDALFVNTEIPVFHWGMIASLVVQFTILMLLFHRCYRFNWKQIFSTIKAPYKL